MLLAVGELSITMVILLLPFFFLCWLSWWCWFNLWLPENYLRLSLFCANNNKTQTWNGCLSLARNGFWKLSSLWLHLHVDRIRFVLYFSHDLPTSMPFLSRRRQFYFIVWFLTHFILMLLRYSHRCVFDKLHENWFFFPFTRHFSLYMCL